MKKKSILEFSKIISGIFTNKEQALENPKKFAHIEIHIRPLFLKAFKCYSFYSEQRYQHKIWNPYRQSVNKLSQKQDLYIISNHDIENKERLIGGGLDMKLLNNISEYKLYQRYGCSMHFIENNPGQFKGFVEPGNKCSIHKGGEITYVKSKVNLNNKILITEDSGYDRKTNKKVWGSKFGPLIFKKIKNFDNFIDINW
tara:strand:- start:761 stop:1357 length:597 start_codon:yes stop_codon:yes gene_type:complete